MKVTFHPMTWAVVFVLSACFVNAQVANVQGQQLSKLLKEAAEVRKQEVLPVQEELNKAMRVSSTEVSTQMQMISKFKSIMKNPPAAKPTDPRDPFGAPFGARQSTETELKYLKARVAMLESALEFETSSEEDQAKRLKEAEAKLTAMQAEQRKLQMPLQKKMQELYQKYAAKSKEFGDVMKPVFRDQGAGDLTDVRLKSVRGQFQFLSVYATFEENSQSVLQIQARYAPEQRTKSTKVVEKLGEDVDLLYLHDRSATIRAGDFSVSVSGMKDGWTKDRIKQAAKQLVDLKWLSKMDPNREIESDESDKEGE